jgi:hypothetical protein
VISKYAMRCRIGRVNNVDARVGKQDPSEECWSSQELQLKREIAPATLEAEHFHSRQRGRVKNAVFGRTRVMQC